LIPLWLWWGSIHHHHHHFIIWGIIVRIRIFATFKVEGFVVSATAAVASAVVVL
jgi:hypothetical protein